MGRAAFGSCLTSASGFEDCERKPIENLADFGDLMPESLSELDDSSDDDSCRRFRSASVSSVSCLRRLSSF